MDTILLHSPSGSFPDIVANPEVMVGKPRIVGTRITVELLLGKLAAGETPDDLKLAYPHLPPNSIAAALAYAHAMVRNDTGGPSSQRSV